MESQIRVVKLKYIIVISQTTVRLKIENISNEIAPNSRNCMQHGVIDRDGNDGNYIGQSRRQNHPISATKFLMKFSSPGGA